MTILDAHEYFASIPESERESILPGDYFAEGPSGRADAWPAACVAACIVAGWLATAESEADLCDGVRQFRMLADSEIISDVDAKLEEEMSGVLLTLLEWGESSMMDLPEPSVN